jgi:hypothetical protein
MTAEDQKYLEQLLRLAKGIVSTLEGWVKSKNVKN